MKHIPSGKIMYEAIMDTTVQFEEIDYERMNVYLFLVVGAEVMRKHGLTKIPSRKSGKSKARSLLSTSNRLMDNWITHETNYTALEKKIMLALTVQVGILLIMTSSC